MNFRQILMAAATQPAAASVASYAAWPALIGAEMMVNPDCSSGTGWTLPAGVVIAAGKMTATAAGSVVTNDGVADDSMIDGATYRNVFTIDSRSSGSAQLSNGSTSGTSRNSAGTFSQDIVAANTGPGNDGWLMGLTSATMILDNFSVKSVGLLGVEADWAFTGASVFWQALSAFGPDLIVFDGASAGDKAELTGSAKTSFDAAVSNSTACTVTLSTDAGSSLNGTISVALKGGTPVNFVFDGSGADVSHTVTSGTGSGFILTAGSDFPSGDIIRVQIALA